jgi:hypothetical protein
MFSWLGARELCALWERRVHLTRISSPKLLNGSVTFPYWGIGTQRSMVNYVLDWIMFVELKFASVLKARLPIPCAMTSVTTKTNKTPWPESASELY